MNRRKSEKAFTLVEVVVAAVLLFLVWIAIVDVIIIGKVSSLRSRHKIQAMYVAEQSIEDIRKLTFASIATPPAPATVIIDDRGTPTVQSDDITGTRTVTVTNYTTYKRVVVEVRWNEKLPVLGTILMREYCGTYIANDPQAN